jgi:CRISPR/Cas system-associated endonuclease Cas1
LRLIGAFKKKGVGLIVKFLIIFFALRGLLTTWSDFKNYIVVNELKKHNVTLNVIEEFTIKPLIIDSVVTVKVNKNQLYKDRMFKEKGIIVTDEDIKKYGLVK